MADLFGLPLLKQIMRASGPDERSVFAPERMRFALEHTSDGQSVDDIQETLRSTLIHLLESENFTLEPVFEDQVGEDSYFFLFSPNGVDRTLPDTLLYSITSDMRVQLELISCEPDTGAPVYPVPERGRAPTPEGAIVEAFCLVDGTPPEPKDWAIHTVNVPGAWSLAPGRGDGVIIVQPDTGIAAHNELSGINFDFSRTLNLIEGGTDPTDPLTSKMSNPGHGTATVSVLASPDVAGAISGVAPGASVVPIRCINDVKVTDPLPVARAIDHAVSVGANVITMSLGGFGSRALRRAIKKAVKADVIVLSAAGNCIGPVVWPARYREVIAVGGTNVHNRKWKGSCSGDAVDISAPAEHVWKAQRDEDVDILNGIQAGQGTSYAVAICAGIAALWLEKNGIAAVKAEALQRGISMTDLFRQAARQTAHRPADFPNGMGAGVIDADALLALSLNEISSAVPESALVASADLSDGIEDALTEVLGPGTSDPGFDWAAHGSEIASLLFADVRAGRSQNGDAHEARAFRDTTERLQNAATASKDTRIADLSIRTLPSAPAIMVPSMVSKERLARLLAGFGASSQPGLSPESAGAVTPEQGQAALNQDGQKRALEQFKEKVQSSQHPQAQETLNTVQRDLADLSQKGLDAPLNDMSTFQLEALVSLTERPALPVTTRQTLDGVNIQTVDENDPQLGRFAGLVALALPDLEERALSSVGRIDGDGIHLGTGWVIGDGLVMTNRHVLEEFAAPIPRLENPDSWQIFRDTVINFSPAANVPEQSFRITDVAFAGAQPIRAFPINFDKLDLALLVVETENDAGIRLPPAVARGMGGLSPNKELFTVGYPAPPFYIPRDEHGQLRRDVIDRLREIFGLEYRQKYFSPGLVMDQGTSWVFDHDSTTLGGNSGSLIGSLSGGIAAMGLHFAGDWLRANHAHDLNAVLSVDPALAALVS